MKGLDFEFNFILLRFVRLKRYIDLLLEDLPPANVNVWGRLGFDWNAVETGRIVCKNSTLVGG